MSGAPAHDWPLARFGAAELETAWRFSDAFTRGQMHGVRAADTQHPPIGAVLAARDSVARCLSIVGPLGGSVLWCVVGVGAPVKDWVQLQRDAGLTMDHGRALGILAEALSTLAVHYGLARPPARQQESQA